MRRCGICSPALLFSSATDHAVPPANQQEIYGATMDNDKELVFAKTLEFVAAHALKR
jgi:esterase/lipase